MPSLSTFIRDARPFDGQRAPLSEECFLAATVFSAIAEESGDGAACGRRSGRART